MFIEVDNTSFLKDIELLYESEYIVIFVDNTQTRHTFRRGITIGRIYVLIRNKFNTFSTTTSVQGGIYQRKENSNVDLPFEKLLSPDDTIWYSGKLRLIVS